MKTWFSVCALLIGCWVPVSAYEWLFLSSIEETTVIEKWLYAGPFSVGAREGVTGVIEDAENFRPREGMEHPSIMAQGGRVRWKEVTSEKGVVELEFEDVWWDTLQDIYGIAGVINAGYAYGEFENSGERRALVVAERVGSFLLNGKRFPGGVYGHGYVVVPVILRDGLNRVLVRVGGAGDHRFTFKLIPAPSPVMVIAKDATVPDVIRGEQLKAWVGISILNTASKTLEGVVLSIAGAGFHPIQEVVESIPPLSVMKVPLRIETRQAIKEGDAAYLRVFARYDHPSLGRMVSFGDSLKLRIRDEGESFKRTFISKIDGSCQYYALLPPEGYRPDLRYGLILTLHGAGVRASGQVDAYTQKDWAFVVAPTNRRRFGFDWQDWGRLDCLEVLEEVKRDYPIDENRVYLTGHSMGGHGVWHIGLSHPDLFAAIGPSAGWTSFQLYVPWFLQKSYIFGHPGQTLWRDMVLRADNPLAFLENGSNLPIFILQGGADDNVPPVQARLFAEGLTDLGYQFIYREVEGKGHWWDEEGIEGTACVNHPELIDFLKSHMRDPYPRTVRFRATDLGLNNRSYWVEMDEQETPYGDSRVAAEVVDGAVALDLTNVSQLTLHLTEELIKPGDIQLRVNGEGLRCRWEGDKPLSIYKKGDRYVVGSTKKKGSRKTPSLQGPMKQAYFSPFLLVYGTSGDSASNEASLHHARLQAFSWWRRANGLAQVLPDTEVTSEQIRDYNLILFGNEETNRIVARIGSRIPVTTRKGRVLLGKRELPAEDLATQVVYPNPLNPKKLVVIYAATSPEAVKFSGFFSTLHSGAGVPDFVVYERSVRRTGWGGVVAAGFFDKNWKLSRNLMWVKEQQNFVD